jgi:hypothetical protein
MSKQTMELEVALEALTLILPLAKGYAALNDVGSNRQYCANAESAIAELKEAIKQQGEPGAKWVCPRCNVDRLKAPCPAPTGNCPMTGTAYTSAPTIPEGWQLVPKKLDVPMREVLANYFEAACKGRIFLFDDFWNVLLSAASEYKGNAK